MPSRREERFSIYGASPAELSARMQRALGYIQDFISHAVGPAPLKAGSDYANIIACLRRSAGEWVPARTLARERLKDTDRRKLHNQIKQLRVKGYPIEWRLDSYDNREYRLPPG